MLSSLAPRPFQPIVLQSDQASHTFAGGCEGKTEIGSEELQDDEVDEP